MGRIRTLKPGFFRSESLSRCSLEARITFAGLWTEADDMGRGDATPRLLATALWPWDNPTDDDISGWLDELVATDHIVLYQHRGKMLFQVLRWSEHQSAAFRRGTSQFPEPPESAPCTPLQDSARVGVQESAYKTRQDVDGIGVDRQQTATDDSHPDAVGQSVVIYAEHVYNTNQGACRTTPKRYKAGVARNALTDYADELDQYIGRHPDATPQQIAHAVFGVPNPKAEPPPPAWFADPNCEHCPGDGVANLAPDGSPAEYGPCPCRRSEPYPMATVHELRPA